MKTLTTKQKELLTCINKVNEVGTYENECGYFYCETGSHKAFNLSTVKALIEKGDVELSENYDGDGVYFLKPIKTNVDC
jgi:mannose-1-phosphate guanylyltransferase